MYHCVSSTQTQLPSVPPGTDWRQAVPIVLVTLVVALIGGGILHGLGRNRSCLLRMIVVVVFTLLVVAGLMVAWWVAYDPFNNGGKPA